MPTPDVDRLGARRDQRGDTLRVECDLGLRSGAHRNINTIPDPNPNAKERTPRCPMP
jgi:hypothetical protein